ncbi:protein FRA10AC1-like [Diadema antillarum]|uniref:protein FRA10AC1-like n=1 Tax=Diadema antillarum TaxID=105358 RepID=UPI003A89E801
MDLTKAFRGGGYGSEFEYDSEAERRKSSRQDLATKDGVSRVTGGLPSKRVAAAEYDREESKNQRFHFLALDAYNRHKQLINDYLLYYPGATKELFKRDTSKDKTDLDVIRENHRFLWTEDDEQESSWGRRLAKKYWDKLFKEYCIADLSRYKENKIAMRWRVEKEVVHGKGHFICGNKTCIEQEGLRTWEVNFGYLEHGEKKNALVKLRLCERCSHKLNYHRKCKEVTRKPSSGSKSKKREDSGSPSQKRRKSGESKKHKHRDGHRDSDRDRHKRKHRKKEKHKKRSRRRSRSRSSSDSDDSSHGNRERPSSSKDEGASSVSESNFWTGPAPVTEEKSREEEFDDYLKDMFL